MVDLAADVAAVGVGGVAGPVGGAGVDRVGQVAGRLPDGLADVLPGLGIGGDLVGVAGQLVQRVLQGFDVLDEPVQPVGDQRADRVQGHGQHIQAHPERADATSTQLPDEIPS
jgi:hypothetical protein